MRKKSALLNLPFAVTEGVSERDLWQRPESQQGLPLKYSSRFGFIRDRARQEEKQALLFGQDTLRVLERASEDLCVASLLSGCALALSSPDT